MGPGAFPLKHDKQDGGEKVTFDFSQTELTQIQSNFSFLDLPELKDMSGVAKRHPEFFTIAHRSNENLEELNNTNREITKNINEFSKEDRKVDEIKLSFLLIY